MKPKIKQKHYHQIEVDLREKDIVQIWGIGKKVWGTADSEVIQLERSNIPALIKVLQKAQAQKV